MTTRRDFLGVLALAAGAPALAAVPAPGTRLAALSLLGDRLLIVGSQMSTGSRLDRNRRDYVELPTDDLDIAAAREIERQARSARPGLSVVPIRSRDRALRQLQDDVVAGGSIAVIADRLRPALVAQGFTHLVLLARHRAEARIRTSDGLVGLGRLEGLGFYVDRWTRLRIADAGGESGLGFLAPFAYFRAALVDLGTGQVLAEEFTREAESVPTLQAREGAHPWDTLSADEKSAALEHATARGLAVAMPLLLGKLAAPGLASPLPSPA